MSIERDLDEIRELIALYRAAHYEVRLPGGERVALLIGQPCPSALIAWSAGRTLACITAYNPQSRSLPAVENRQRQRELFTLLDASGAKALPAVGRIPGQPWREPSLLATGVELASIDALAHRFEQNAIVIVGESQKARLRICRDDWRGAI
ncbi:MAG: DUF3293 domain-containing protein [Dokdonella sp.]